MARMLCPHCHSPVADTPSLAGQQVACSRCHGQFVMPGRVAVVPSQVVMPVAPQPEPPAFTIRIASDPRTRVKPSGWFSRSFAGAGGALIAAFIFLLACGGVIYGGVNYLLYRTKESIVTSTQGSTSERAEAMKAARTVLGKHGYSDLSKDAGVSKWTLDGDASHVIDGYCRKAGESHRFMVYFDRRAFDNVTEWKFVRLEIDGETIVDQSPTKKRLDEALKGLEE